MLIERQDQSLSPEIIMIKQLSWGHDTTESLLVDIGLIDPCNTNVIGERKQIVYRWEIIASRCSNMLL